MAPGNFIVLAISCALVASGWAAPSSSSSVVRQESVTTISEAQSTNPLGFQDIPSAAAVNREKRQAPPEPQQPKQCQATGGYCRYHEDCCSKLCLSFSYKCVTASPQSPFTPVIPGGQSAGAQAGAEDVVNRFGEGDTKPSSGVGGGSAAPAVCAQVGEYCQRSSDCCSRTCLSFSYRCVGNALTPVFRPPSSSSTNSNNVFEIGQSIPRPDEISVDELVNRFGGGGVEENTNSVIPLVTNRAPEIENHVSGVQVPTATLQPPVAVPRPQHEQQQGPMNSSSAASAIAAASNPQCIGTGGQCRSSNQCCSSLCVQIAANNQLCAEPVNQRPPPPSQVSTQCLDIGFKCYAHAECCSGRCHMFLHQCVT